MQFPENLMQKFHRKMGANTPYKERYLIYSSLKRAIFTQIGAFLLASLCVATCYYEYLNDWSSSYYYHFALIVILLTTIYLQRKAINHYHSNKYPGALFALEDRLFIVWDSTHIEKELLYKNITSVEDIEESTYGYYYFYYTIGTKVVGKEIKDKHGNSYKFFNRKMPVKISNALLNKLYDLSW